MKKLLRFEIKQNLRKPARVYVRSVESNELYGSFKTNEPNEFDGFEKLSQDELLELRQYIQNINAINKYLSSTHPVVLTDFRLKLPAQFVDTLLKLSAICEQEKIELDIFDSIITSMAHQMRIATSKLEGQPKMKALALLDSANIADFKKQTHVEQIQSVFSELQAIYNRSEKLHEKAKSLFNKDKSYSPLAIKGMAIGDTLPSKWLVACAIDLLLDETPERIKSLLTENDLYLLWVKPLKDSNYSNAELIERAHLLKVDGLIKKIQDT